MPLTRSKQNGATITFERKRHICLLRKRYMPLKMRHEK